MVDDKLQQKLIDYVEDAHAMEQNVSRMLDSMMATTDDPEIEQMLRHHKEETERHEQRLRERLDALGADRKSTRLNSSHANISYAVFCLKKKTQAPMTSAGRTTCKYPR